MSFEQVETVTQPSSLPITVNDAKDYLRIEGNIDDEVVLNCIRAATDWISTSDGCGYALMKQRWRFYPPQLNQLDRQWQYNATRYYCPTDWHIRVPGWPLASTTGTLKYTKLEQTNETTVSITLSNPHQTGFIYALRPDAGWPQQREADKPVSIEYEVGNTERSKIPHDLKMAVRLLTARFYENRGAAEVDPGIERIIGKYRRWA